jgi:hypothetical protein
MSVADRLYVPAEGDIEHIYPPQVVYAMFHGKWCRAEHAGTKFSLTGAHPTPVFYLAPAPTKEKPNPKSVFVTLALSNEDEHARAYDILKGTSSHAQGDIAHCAWISDHFRKIALGILTSEMERLAGWVLEERSRGEKFQARLEKLRAAGDEGIIVNESPKVYERMDPTQEPEYKEDGSIVYRTQISIGEQDAPENIEERSCYGGPLDDYDRKQGWERHFPCQKWTPSKRVMPGWMDNDGTRYKPEYDLLMLAARRLRDILGVSDFPEWPSLQTSGLDVVAPEGWEINPVSKNYWGVKGAGRVGAIVKTKSGFGWLGPKDTSFRGRAVTAQEAFDALRTYLENPYA